MNEAEGSKISNEQARDAEWWSGNTFVAHIEESINREKWPQTIRFQCGRIEFLTLEPGRTPAYHLGLSADPYDRCERCIRKATSLGMVVG